MADRAADPGPGAWTRASFAGRLRETLLPRPETPTHLDQFRLAAVLFFVQFVAGTPHLVLTLRSKRLGKHAGEVSFPGGRFDPAVDADATDAALREAREEVGVDPGGVEVVGYLENVHTLTRYCVVPVVALAKDELEAPRWPLPVSRAEVVRVALVPLEFFQAARPPVFRQTAIEFGGRPFPVYSFRWRDLNVWGATAHLIVSFLRVVGLPGPPASEARRFSPEEILEFVRPETTPRFPVRRRSAGEG
ncbi:MAG: CoA pyrophosphatase [Promethearchaeota archaeon]